MNTRKRARSSSPSLEVSSDAGFANRSSPFADLRQQRPRLEPVGPLIPLVLPPPQPNPGPRSRAKSEECRQNADDPTTSELQAGHDHRAAFDCASTPSPAPPSQCSALPVAARQIDDLRGHVESLLLARFAALPTTHPIFGEISRDMVRMPMISDRKNGRCWTNECKNIAASVVKEMGNTLAEGSCWMSKKAYIDIAVTTGAASVTVMRKVATVRLLAFLQVPSAANWERLEAQMDDDAGERPTDWPFSHACGNGITKERKTAKQPGCINGFEHGTFAPRSVNEGHKKCTNGALVLCPGHGIPAVKCIFVHDNGVVKPCKMQADCVPAGCAHTPRCYP